MKKIINDASAFVDEIVEGILLAHPTQLRAVTPDQRGIVRTQAPAGRVGIVTGGGSGHLPFFLGYVGAGLASGVAVGNIFSSPSAQQILATTRASEEGAGVLHLYGNYGGDVYNFDLAGDLAEAEGIATRTVIGTDDVMSAPAERAEERRGVAGLIFAYKTAGAAADRGDDLASVAEIAQRTIDRTRTMGVGLSPTILPAAGEPTFTLDAGEMEVGIGIHGEPGHHRGPLEDADSITRRLLNAVQAEFSLQSGDEVAVIVNGMGSTPLEELYVMYRYVHRALAAQGITIRRRYIGEYTTSLEMAGASLSLLRLDDELAELLEEPACSPFFSQGLPTEASPQHGELPEPGSCPPADDDTLSALVAGLGSPADFGAPVEVGRCRGVALRAVVLAVAEAMPAHVEELRELDSALGDGDLGVTVGAGAQEVRRAVEALPDGAQAADVLRTAGAAFASANPSTFAALFGGALVAASRSMQTQIGGQADPGLAPADPGLAECAALTDLLQERVQERGGAEVGDKTFVDVLDAVGRVLTGAVQHPDGDEPPSEQVLRDAVGAAEKTVEDGAALPSRRGRAKWVGADGQRHPDPGSVAVLRMIQEARRSLS